MRVATLVQAKAMASAAAGASSTKEEVAVAAPRRSRPAPPPPPPPPPPPSKPLSEAEVAALLHAKAPAQISGTQPDDLSAKAAEKAGVRGGTTTSALGSALKLELSGTGRGGLHVPKKRVVVRPEDVHGRARHRGNIGDLYVHEGG